MRKPAAVNMREVKPIITTDRKIIYLLLGIIFGLAVGLITMCPKASALTREQEDTADLIADITTTEHPNYGILPSVAVGQAFVESTLGDGPNLFGVNGDAGKSAVASIYGYLKCMHNEYFRGEAAFINDREDQLAVILKGGRYCEGEYPYGTYYYNVINSIYKYGWDKYDKPIMEAAKRKQEKAEQERLEDVEESYRKSKWDDEFLLVHNPMLLPWQVVTDPDVIAGGAILIGYDWMDVVGSRKGLGMIIETGNRYQALCIRKTLLTEVVENAVG